MLKEFDLKAAINARLTEMIQQTQEEVIAEVVKNFEYLVRKQVGLTALAVLDTYSVERMGSELLIRVKIS